MADNEQLGNDGNWGCRMSEAEIRGFISQLRAVSGLFGGIKFWPPEPALNEVVPGIVNRPMTFNEFDILVLQDNWASGHLNIYFAGYVYTRPPVAADVFGFTADPFDDPARSYIVINDGGGPSTVSGFLVLPSELTQVHLLEHEVAHFFLRRINCSPYDDGEHVPDGSINLLTRTFNVPDRPFPLTLPSSEQNEIRCRVGGDTWVYPSDTCGSNCSP